MGTHLLSVTLLTLVTFLAIDAFSNWYQRFLANRPQSEQFKNIVIKIFWATMTLMFWYAFYKRNLPQELGFGHFAFAVFIFSFYGLTKQLFR